MSWGPPAVRKASPDGFSKAPCGVLSDRRGSPRALAKHNTGAPRIIRGGGACSRSVSPPTPVTPRPAIESVAAARRVGLAASAAELVAQEVAPGSALSIIRRLGQSPPPQQRKECTRPWRPPAFQRAVDGAPDATLPRLTDNSAAFVAAADNRTPGRPCARIAGKGVPQVLGAVKIAVAALEAKRSVPCISAPESPDSSGTREAAPVDSPVSPKFGGTRDGDDHAVAISQPGNDSFEAESGCAGPVDDILPSGSSFLGSNYQRLEPPVHSICLSRQAREHMSSVSSIPDAALSDATGRDDVGALGSAVGVVDCDRWLHRAISAGDRLEVSTPGRLSCDAFSFAGDCASDRHRESVLERPLSPPSPSSPLSPPSPSSPEIITSSTIGAALLADVEQHGSPAQLQNPLPAKQVRSISPHMLPPRPDCLPPSSPDDVCVSPVSLSFPSECTPEAVHLDCAPEAVSPEETIGCITSSLPMQSSPSSPEATTGSALRRAEGADSLAHGLPPRPGRTQPTSERPVPSLFADASTPDPLSAASKRTPAHVPSLFADDTAMRVALTASVPPPVFGEQGEQARATQQLGHHSPREQVAAGAVAHSLPPKPGGSPPAMETPREAANRRKRETADREMQRLAEATMLHLVEQPIRRRPIVEDAEDDYQVCSTDVRSTSVPYAFPVERGPGETPREAVQRRKREAADRDAEIMNRLVADENTSMPRAVRPHPGHNNSLQQAGSPPPVVGQLARPAVLQSPRDTRENLYCQSPRDTRDNFYGHEPRDARDNWRDTAQRPVVGQSPREARDNWYCQSPRDARDNLHGHEPRDSRDNTRDSTQGTYANRADGCAGSQQFSPQQLSPDCRAATPQGMDETPREFARRRKCEAADRDAARLCLTHTEAASASRQMGQRLREIQARSFVAPFATAHDVRRGQGDAGVGGSMCHTRCNVGSEGAAKYPVQQSHLFASPKGTLRELPGHSSFSPCKDLR